MPYAVAPTATLAMISMQAPYHDLQWDKTPLNKQCGPQAHGDAEDIAHAIHINYQQERVDSENKPSFQFNVLCRFLWWKAYKSYPTTNKHRGQNQQLQGDESPA